MKQWLASVAACAVVVASPLSATAQRIIEIPRAGDPVDTTSPPSDERIYEERTAPGCWISTTEIDDASGRRTVTRQVCH